MRLWLSQKEKQIPKQISEFGLENLYRLYKAAWVRLKEGNLTIAHPGAFYNTVKAISLAGLDKAGSPVGGPQLTPEQRAAYEEMMKVGK